ncbi:MAG: RagB/SusD family nutrient uptake outer membrane protein [Bacteroides sp.]|nr:RagB/SusD family nutrient uptake outer membrane protein [Bacteroides sp.]
MKKLIITCCAALTVFGATSCGDDFLTVSPSSSLPADEYYNSKSRIFEAVVAAYDPLQWFDYFSGWAPLHFIYDSMSDDVYVGGGHDADQLEIHLISKFTSVASTTIAGAWTTAYSGINRCNNVLEKIEDLTMAEKDKALFQAEAWVLRAWYYCTLWKLWGNIPYYDTNLTYPYIAEQYTADDLYKVVEADLAEILDSKILPMKQSAEWAGRVTQAMASMVYAEFVMYQKDESKYSKALGYMTDIINSNQYSLQPFENLWETEFEWNDETIFDVNYIAKGGRRTWDEPLLTGGTVWPCMIGIDGLTGSPDYDGGGWGFEPVTPTAYEMYEEADRRRDIGILNIEKYIADYAAKGITVTYGGRYQNTGFFLKKYQPRVGDNADNSGSAELNWDNNLRVYRYAETLLNAAELAVRTGSGNTQGYLDEVRERAGLTSIPATLDNIFNERHLEFVGEGKRYFDLVRFGKAADVLKPNQYGRVQWTENKKHLPIPQGEINAALGTLIQNPYEN